MTDIERFSCSTCKFSSKTNYCLERHFASKKHCENIQSPETCITKFKCNKCEKYYKRSSGLWAHKKICKIVLSEVTSSISEQIAEEGQVNLPAVIQEPYFNQEKLEDMLKKVTLQIAEQMNEQINIRMDKLTQDLKTNQQITTINNNNTTNNNTFNMNIFLNEKCGDAINFEDFINKLAYHNADPKLMIGDYVNGTSNIFQISLEDIPVNMRPLHYLVGEDPHQQLMHIRQDDKWNVGTELNWMKQIHADDDDLVEKKNPIYYALKRVDDAKLSFLSSHFRMNPEYKIQHGRLNRETSRPDFKEKVYQNILKMITLDPNKLDGIDKKRKIEM